MTIRTPGIFLLRAFDQGTIAGFIIINGALVIGSKFLFQFHHPIAILSSDKSGWGDLLMARLSNNPKISLVERDVLGKALDEVELKGATLEAMLREIPEIHTIRRVGLMFACDMESDERVAKVVNRLLELGLISFWFLSHPYSFRLSPPLTITMDEIQEAGKLIQQAVSETND